MHPLFTRRKPKGPSTHVPRVATPELCERDKARYARIAARSNDPRRKQKLQQLLAKSRAKVPLKPLPAKPVAMTTAPRSSSAMEGRFMDSKTGDVRSVASKAMSHSLPRVPRLAMGTSLDRLKPPDRDTDQLNRNLMWEEIIAAGAAQAEAAEKMERERRAAEVRKAQEQNRQIIIANERKAKREQRNKWVVDRARINADVEAFKREEAEAQAKRREEERATKQAVLAHKAEKDAEAAAERAEALAEERRANEAAIEADKVLQDQQRARAARDAALKKSYGQVAERNRRRELARRKKPKDDPPDPFVAATEKRDHERVSIVERKKAEVELRMHKGAEFVHKDAERRDQVANRHQVDPKPEELTAADEMEKKREADKKARLAAGLEAQMRERRLMKELEEQQKISEAAATRQAALRMDAAYMRRQQELNSLRSVHKHELDHQRAMEEYNRVYGYDRGGKGVSEAEWRMNQRLLKGLKGEPMSSSRPSGRYPAPTSSIRSTNRGLGGLEMTGRSLAPASSVRMPFASPAIPATAASTFRSGAVAGLIPGGSSRAGDDLASLNQYAAGGTTPSAGTWTPGGVGVGVGSSGVPISSVSDGSAAPYADAADPYYGRTAVRWYDS